MEPAFKVLTEFYSLPRMFGFWICDPEQMRQREEATKKKWWPVALLFFGDHHEIWLHRRPHDEAPDAMVTDVLFHVYDIDGPTFVVQQLILEGEEEVRRSEAAEVPWSLSDDGRLNFLSEGIMWRYIPAGIDDLVAAGFSRVLIESYIRDFEEAGEEVIEKFDETKARQLIKEARAKEEAEN